MLIEDSKRYKKAELNEALNFGDDLIFASYRYFIRKIKIANESVLEVGEIQYPFQVKRLAIFRTRNALRNALQYARKKSNTRG